MLGIPFSRVKMSSSESVPPKQIDALKETTRTQAPIRAAVNIKKEANDGEKTFLNRPFCYLLFIHSSHTKYKERLELFSSVGMHTDTHTQRWQQRRREQQKS